jgi:HAE1 family hydrophobic/amphiphilic exporter-1
MVLSRLAIRRPVFITMVMTALIVFGWVSYRRLGVDLFPRVEFPIVTILTRLPGSDPETIETTVTDLVEEAVNTISGIKHLRSTSADSVSQVVVEFELTKDIDVAFQEITAKVAGIRARLPEDVEEPVVEKFDVDSAPIATVVVAGDMPFRELARIAEKSVKDRLQRLPNVGSARLVGFRDRKIWVWLDPALLLRHELAVTDVIQALRRQHVEVPGGRIETGPRDIVAKLAAEFTSAEELASLVVGERGTSQIRLSDVGFAEDGFEEETSRAMLDGRPCIAVQVRRQSGTNTVEVANAVRAEVQALRGALGPAGVRLELAEEQAPFIERSVDEVKHHLVMGGGLAVLIVLFFLLNFRSTFISSLVLPTSVIATFMAMAAMGLSLNMMTLLGLSLAIGLLIDDAIVVQESIMRRIEEGMPAREAADRGTSEIGLAVIATTLSVVAVFIPVAFMGGLVGRFFASFALTVSVAVLISMFVSFTLDPMLSSRILAKPKRRGFVFRALEGGFAWLEKLYERVLAFSLRHRWLVVLLAIGALASMVVLGPRLRSEFIPVEDQSEFNVKVRAPLGASVDTTSAILARIETRVREIPEKQYLFSSVGSDELARANEGTLYVKLVDKAHRSRSQEQVMNDVRQSLAGIPDAVISVQIVPKVSGGGRRWAQVQFELRGQELGELDRISRELRARMAASGGYVDLDSTFETGKPELDVRVLRERAVALGISPADVGQTLRAAIGGLDVSKFKAEGDRYDIAVRLFESARKKPEAVDDLRIRSASGRLVELRNVATAREVGAPVEIARYNRQRQVTVLANLSGKVLGEATTEIEKLTQEIGLPAGYATGWVGFADTMKETTANMQITLILAVIVIYLVLASQFESFAHPFTIMLTLPLAFIGAIASLVLFDKTVTIYVSMAFIFLMGLVTKNAILVIDLTNTLRRRDGLSSRDALLKAGPIRLRPILMTTVAMIAGMLPVAMGTGAGSESRQPMAIAIIGGLTSSTLLTLLVVPTAYSLLDQAIAGGGKARRAALRVLGRGRDAVPPERAG